MVAPGASPGCKSSTNQPRRGVRMSHTYSNLLTHFIFSTKDRAPLIEHAIRERVITYLGGITRELKGVALATNAVADHVHILIHMPADVAAAEIMRVVKTNSSRWIHEQWPSRKSFAWQAGYGAFSVSESNCAAVREYIARQEEHHRRMTFQEEFVAFLKRHHVEYDPKYIWE
jgi:putative transposase